MTAGVLLSFICLQYAFAFLLPVYCTRSPCICSTYSLIVSMFTVLTFFDCLLPVHFTIVSMFTVLDLAVHFTCFISQTYLCITIFYCLYVYITCFNCALRPQKP